MYDVVTIASSTTERMSPGGLAAATDRLSDSEQQRAGTIRLERPRRAFVLGRLLLRSTVARIAGVRPDEVGIDLEPAGRPVLTGELSHYFVSIAHSGRDVVVGVAKRPIGLDVEGMRSAPPSPQLMARVCSPDELRVLAEMTDVDRAAAFMKVWTRKEAYGKAIGRGIGFGLSSVTVGLAASSVIGDWRFEDLDVGPGRVAAVVAQGQDWRAHLERVDSCSL